MKSTFSLIIIALFLSLHACNGINDSSSTDKTILLKDPRIALELEQMIKSEDPYAFVTFEVAGTGKFVQFSSNKHADLAFDLPSKQLTPEELQKATSVLETYDIFHETSVMYEDETETEVVGEMDLFNKDIDRDVSLAIELTSRIILEVFGEDENVKLVITTN